MKTKTYETIDVTGMADDPANAAGELLYVGHDSMDIRRAVGVWRWHLMHKHRQKLLEVIENRRVIDFGGAAAPLGYGAIIVDQLAECKALYDVEGEVDTIVASHVLEHVADLPGVLHAIHQKLTHNGTLVIHGPHWTFTKLRAENWPSHRHNFAFSTEENVPDGDLRIDDVCRMVGFWPGFGEAERGTFIFFCHKP